MISVSPSCRARGRRARRLDDAQHRWEHRARAAAYRPERTPRPDAPSDTDPPAPVACRHRHRPQASAPFSIRKRPEIMVSSAVITPRPKIAMESEDVFEAADRAERDAQCTAGG